MASHLNTIRWKRSPRPRKKSRRPSRSPEDFKSYVCIHVYNSEAVDRALDAGVKCVEHAFLVNEATVRRMKKDGIVLSANYGIKASKRSRTYCWRMTTTFGQC